MAYDYGCVMAKSSWPDGWEKMLSEFDGKDVYTEEDGTCGLETDPHATVLYGLHDQVHEDLVYRVCEGAQGPLEVEVEGASVFEKEEFDVLKLDLKSPTLQMMNEAFRSFPYTNDYDSYNPHMTVAYLKKGKKGKYTDKIEEMAPESVVFPKMEFQPSGDTKSFSFQI